MINNLIRKDAMKYVLEVGLQGDKEISRKFLLRVERKSAFALLHCEYNRRGSGCRKVPGRNPMVYKQPNGVVTHKQEGQLHKGLCVHIGFFSEPYFELFCF